MNKQSLSKQMTKAIVKLDDGKILNGVILPPTKFCRRNPSLGAEERDGSSPTRSVIRRNEGEETKEFGERTDRAVGPHSLFK